MADSKKYDGSQWEHSLRKLTTATDTITTLPADLYADGNNATVGLVGNMVQSGTPTPQNPIQPSECGERTENLCNISGFTSGETEQKLLQTVTLNTGTYTYSCAQNDTLSSNARNCLMIRIGQAAYTYESTQTNYHLSTGRHSMTFTVPADNTSVELRYWVSNFSNACDFDSFMLNTGSTALPYEPYGYKIPISSGGVTTNIYLGSTQSTRQIKKLVLDGTENWDFWNGGTGVYYLSDIQDYLKINGITCVCSHYPANDNVEGASYAQYGVCFILNHPAYRLYIVDIAISSVNDFKAWLAAQYANGTPVTIWYVLAEPTTGIVNEPIRKIGDYADTVSGITIPTIAGADSFDVETTLKPSEVSLSYTGWHDATVGEWDGSQWNQ